MPQKLTLLALVAMAACAHGVAPTPAPVPARTPDPGPAAATAATTAAATPSTSGATTTDTAATAEAPSQDSASRAAKRADGASADDSVSSTEVSKRAEEVLGTPPADSAAARNDASEEPSWDMDVRSYESVDRVQHFVRLFSGPAKEHVEARLAVGSRYEPMIREKMRKGGLPEDMYYLGLVESGFNPNAYSKAAAVGMWQFMTSTARDMGMRVDWWVDERRDPVRSTIAAVRFIRGLKEQFGSLYLAAAAYDGGPGRIARGLSRYADDLEGTSGEDLFFALADKDYLKSETKDYVPQLIAAALIGKDPHRYGMEIRTEPPYVYDSVRVGPATPLAAIAKASGTTVAVIKDLNPHVLRGMTPPRGDFKVRIPVGRLAGFDSALAELPKTERVGYHVIESRKGEYADDLAHRAGISVHILTEYNPELRRSKKTGRIFPGQRVMVPNPEVAAAAVNVPDPTIEKYPGSLITSVHIVKRGETLSGIALHYHSSVKSLMALNGLRRPMIFAGQELVVRGRVPRSRGHQPDIRQAGSRKRTHTTRSHESSRASGESSSERAATPHKSAKKSAAK